MCLPFNVAADQIMKKSFMPMVLGRKITTCAYLTFKLISSMGQVV